jgi:hypothetical protein
MACSANTNPFVVRRRANPARLAPVSFLATALAVEALEEELPRTKIAYIASSVLARSNEAERAKRNHGESAWPPTHIAQLAWLRYERVWPDRMVLGAF